MCVSPSGPTEGVEDAEDAAEAAGVADVLVHDVPDGELRALAALVEGHALRLRRRVHPLPRRRQCAAE